MSATACDVAAGEELRRVIFGFGEFEFDDQHRTLCRGGTPLDAPAAVKKLLAVLLHHAGEVVTSEQLIRELSSGRVLAHGNVTSMIARLRKLLRTEAGDSEFLETIYGRGYRFVGVVSRAQPESAPHRRVEALDPIAFPPSPLVGRDAVLARLDDALADAWEGRGSMAMLLGDPGIGKTRVLEAFEARLANTQVRISFCRPRGDAPLALWTSLVRSISATAALGFVPHAGFALFERELARSATKVPRVVVLDDLHWADAASLDLLSYAVDRIAHCRVLILAAMRLAPGRRAPRPDTRLPYLLGHRNTERIFLEHLREHDVHAYASAVARDTDGSIGKMLFEKSEGHPLLMAELTRQLLYSSGRTSPDARWLPDSALAPIREQLDQLSSAACAVLAAAAGLGRSFGLARLMTATGQSSSLLMECLDEAIAADLLMRAHDSTTTFRFRCDLVCSLLRAGSSASTADSKMIRIGKVPGTVSCDVACANLGSGLTLRY